MIDDTELVTIARPSRLELARRRRGLLRAPDRMVTRREAADLLGVSLDTVDRCVRLETGEGRTPWGAIGLPAGALGELLRGPWRGRGRPELLGADVAARIVSLREASWTFAAIAAALNDEGVATVHGGARWWPATVRKVVLKAREGATEP